MTENINTTISATASFFDQDGNIVPRGNYYFKINEISDDEFSGDLIQKGLYGKFTFKAKDLVKMMSVGQARLARRANIDEEGIPKCESPSLKNNRLFASFLSGNVTKNRIVRTYDEESLLNIKRNPQCSICLNEIITHEKELQCKHKYHKDCINKWLERSNTCPVCRRSVEEERTTEVLPFRQERMARLNNIYTDIVRARRRLRSMRYRINELE